MKLFVTTLFVLAFIMSSARLPQAQTRGRGQRGSQTRSEPTSGPQKVGEDDVLRITTNLVTIPVSVRAHDGTYLFDLRKEEFHIFEDGVEQEIGQFSSVEQPFHVVVLID